jgi:hypothetical protein
MKSSPPGNNTSAPEITNISAHGIWLLTGGQELFLSYDDFPWFRDHAIKDVCELEEPQPGHFYWPKLDVDLSLDMIQHPENFPLKAKTTHS